MDTCCAGYLFHDPESRCVQGPVWPLRYPILEAMLLEIELRGSQFQASISESGYSFLFPARLSWMGSWFSLFKSCLLLGKWPIIGAVSSSTVVSPVAGGQAYVRYGLCKHSTHTRIYFAIHPPFYASIVSKFQCLVRCHVWHVESPLALCLFFRSDLWLQLQD